MKVFADKFSELQKQFGTSDGLTPVDLNGGYVAVDKYDAKNMEQSQGNIQWKSLLDGNLTEYNREPKNISQIKKEVI